MEQYTSRNGVKVYASTPEDADIAFIVEALKYDIQLCKAAQFDIAQEGFGLGKRYFADVNGMPIAKANEFIVLFDNGHWVKMPRSVFESLYSPIGDYDIIPEVTAKKLKGKSFYIDAGHGGSDPGAVNNNLGLQEKIAALDVALYLGKLLQAQEANVYYSRETNDYYPPLSTRANEANTLNVTAFISIHLNSADNKTASGIETLVYSLTGTAATIAGYVQNNMVKATGFKNRGVKARPDLTVLSKTKMPAILCEIGFISNDTEAQELFKTEVQKKIANAIAEGVIEYYQ